MTIHVVMLKDTDWVWDSEGNEVGESVHYPDSAYTDENRAATEAAKYGGRVVSIELFTGDE